MASAMGGTPLALRTKDYAAGKGVDGDFLIFKADKKQPLKEGQKVDWSAKPTPLGGRLMTRAQLYC